MGDRSGYNARQRGRIIEAVTAAVANRRPGPVLSADMLTLEDVAVAATGRTRATPDELVWIRARVASAIADREAAAVR